MKGYDVQLLFNIIRLSLWVSLCHAATLTDVATLKTHMIDYNTASSVNIGQVQSYMTTISSDGHWSNIDYSNGFNTPPTKHLANVRYMAQGYATPSSSLKGDATLLAKIHLALSFWFATDYAAQQGNWWWGQIGFPQNEGPICVLMQPQLTTSEFNNCVKVLGNAITAGKTGANLVWTAIPHIYLGVITNDIVKITDNFNLIWAEVQFQPAKEDGIKRDGSFYQHGEQEYSGGYGGDLTHDVFNSIRWAVGTAFAIPSSSLDVFSTHVLDGQQWMMQLPSKYWDVSCKGREITWSGGSNLLSSDDFGELFNPGGPRSADWQNFVDRYNGVGSVPAKVGNKAYWMSDYMIHARAGWQSSVKMYSKRTYNSECVNLGGKKSVHLADGANYVQQDGNEYVKIFPLWDWEMIPGTTVEKGVVALACTAVKTYGKTTFAGVVSDGLYGAAAQDLIGPFASTVTAKKSWFFFDDEYVALGAGITATAGRDVVTAVEQNWLQGAVTVSNINGQTNVVVPQSDVDISSAWWVHHDSVGYIFPEASKVLKLNTLTKSGNWIDISSDSGAVSGGTFSLSLPRKTQSVDTYAYIVIPKITAATLASTATTRKANIQILQNSASLQVVYHTVLAQIQATFWVPGVSFTHPTAGYSVTSSTPSLVIIRPTGTDTFNLVISDPTHLLTTTGVIINKQISCSGCTYSGGVTTISITLPTGDYAGKSVVIACTIARTTPAPTVTSTPCYTAASDFLTRPFPVQSQTFYFSLKVTPSVTGGENAVFGLSNGNATVYGEYSVVFRLYETTFTVFHGAQAIYKSDQSVTYVAGTTYTVSIAVRFSDQTFDVKVTPSGQSGTIIASAYPFRVASTQLNYFGLSDRLGSAVFCISGVSSQF